MTEEVCGVPACLLLPSMSLFLLFLYPFFPIFNFFLFQWFPASFQNHLICRNKLNFSVVAETSERWIVITPVWLKQDQEEACVTVNQSRDGSYQGDTVRVANSLSMQALIQQSKGWIREGQELICNWDLSSWATLCGILQWRHQESLYFIVSNDSPVQMCIRACSVLVGWGGGISKTWIQLSKISRPGTADWSTNSIKPCVIEQWFSVCALLTFRVE